MQTTKPVITLFKASTPMTGSDLECSPPAQSKRKDMGCSKIGSVLASTSQHLPRAAQLPITHPFPKATLHEGYPSTSGQ